MIERDILTDSIKAHQKAIDDAKRELEALDTTYSIGDRFRYAAEDADGDREIILSQFDYSVVGMIFLESGENWGGTSAKVKDVRRITTKELERFCNHCWTRYWDARKKVKV